MEARQALYDMLDLEVRGSPKPVLAAGAGRAFEAVLAAWFPASVASAARLPQPSLRSLTALAIERGLVLPSERRELNLAKRVRNWAAHPAPVGWEPTRDDLGRVLSFVWTLASRVDPSLPPLTDAVEGVRRRLPPAAPGVPTEERAVEPQFRRLPARDGHENHHPWVVHVSLPLRSPQGWFDAPHVRTEGVAGDGAGLATLDVTGLFTADDRGPAPLGPERTVSLDERDALDGDRVVGRLQLTIDANEAILGAVAYQVMGDRAYSLARPLFQLMAGTSALEARLRAQYYLAFVDYLRACDAALLGRLEGQPCRPSVVVPAAFERALLALENHMARTLTALDSARASGASGFDTHRMWSLRWHLRHMLRLRFAPEGIEDTRVEFEEFVRHHGHDDHVQGARLHLGAIAAARGDAALLERCLAEAVADIERHAGQESWTRVVLPERIPFSPEPRGLVLAVGRELAARLRSAFPGAPLRVPPQLESAHDDGAVDARATALLVENVRRRDRGEPWSGPAAAELGAVPVAPPAGVEPLGYHWTSSALGGDVSIHHFGRQHGNFSPRRPNEAACQDGLERAALTVRLETLVRLRVDFTDLITDRSRPVAGSGADSAAYETVEAADGFLLTGSDTGVAITSADCPTGVLLARELAVVLHLGLDCLLRPDGRPSVLEAAVRLFRDAGALRFWVGRAAGPCCYGLDPAVDAEKVARLVARFGEHACPGTVAQGPRAGARAVDLVEIAVRLAAELGVEEIETDRICTSCAGVADRSATTPGRFWSHLRDAGRTAARNLVVVRVLPSAFVPPNG